MRYCILALYLLCFLSGVSRACEKYIVVSSQVKFDDVIDRINSGEEVRMYLMPGRYALKTSLLSSAPVEIYGKSAIITSALEINRGEACNSTNNHYLFRLVNPLSLYALFYDENGEIIPISESVIDSVSVNYVEGVIDAPEAYVAGTQIKIPISSNLSHLRNKTFERSYGYLDTGWSVVDFCLNRSDDSYFYCTTLNRCATKNYMKDKTSYGKRVRYVLYNAELKKDAAFFDNDYLYLPKTVKDVFVVNSATPEYGMPTISFNNDISINGVIFTGISGISINSKATSVCSIRNCHFRNITGTALSICKTNGEVVRVATITNCTFDNCSIHTGNMVFLSSTYVGTPCIEMKNCVLSRYPDEVVSYKNTNGAVKLNGDVCFLNNVVYNTCRDHINCGAGRIIVRGNTLYNTDKFNRYVDRNHSSDWGIIYCDHQYTETQAALDNINHRILLENNLLYGAFAYGGDASGIYIDDGRGDVECKSNIILNTQAFSIDSRNVGLTSASSVRNRFDGNIVTSRYKLAAGLDVRGENVPITKGNVLLNSSDNITEGVIIIEEDTRHFIDTKCFLNGGRVFVSSALLKIIRRSPAWRSVRRFIRSK